MNEFTIEKQNIMAMGISEENADKIIAMSFGSERLAYEMARLCVPERVPQKDQDIINSWNARHRRKHL